jgi:hypothetical protein
VHNKLGKRRNEKFGEQPRRIKNEKEGGIVRMGF